MSAAFPSPIPSTRGPLSQALRAATRDLHDRLEDALPLMGEGLTRAVYCAHLRALFPAVAATERVLAPWHTSLVTLTGDLLPLRPRAHLLRADLLALEGQSPPQQALPWQPSPSLPHAVGCWYVVSGARLGGQVIARRVAWALGLQGSMGLAYYGACTRGDGQRFRAFLRAIDALPHLEQHHEQVVMGARDTFALFCRALLPSTPSE